MVSTRFNGHRYNLFIYERESTGCTEVIVQNKPRMSSTEPIISKKYTYDPGYVARFQFKNGKYTKKGLDAFVREVAQRFALGDNA